MDFFHRSTQAMKIEHSRIRTIPVKCAPGQAPCPTCGKLGTRKDIHQRSVRTIAYKQIVYLDITYGECRARCDCCTTFRNTPPGVEPCALYDNQVRDAVLDRILEEWMSIEQVIRSMQRGFLLDLSDGFVYDCLHRQVRQLDLLDHRRWVLARFSGTLCIDELHLGHYTLLLATDPLQDLPVAFALEVVLHCALRMKWRAGTRPPTASTASIPTTFEPVPRDEGVRSSIGTTGDPAEVRHYHQTENRRAVGKVIPAVRLNGL